MLRPAFLHKGLLSCLPGQLGDDFGVCVSLSNGRLNIVAASTNCLAGSFSIAACEGVVTANRPRSLISCVCPIYRAYSIAPARCDFFAGARLVPSSALRGMARWQPCRQRVLWNTSACWLLAKGRWLQLMQASLRTLQDLPAVSRQTKRRPLFPSTSAKRKRPAAFHPGI